jgi:hypothetical protein
MDYYMNLYPVIVPETNTILAAESANPVPVTLRHDGSIIVCWKARSIVERLQFLFTGKIWHTTQSNTLLPTTISMLKPQNLASCESSEWELK